MWSDTLALTVSVNSVVVGSTTAGNIASASYGSGRRDWFDPLSPSTGTFTFKDMTRSAFQTLIGSSTPIGRAVVVALSGSPLWTGVVDTLYEVQTPGEPTALTVTAGDQVAQLGQTRLEDEELPSDRIEDQIVDVFGFAGLSPTIEFLPTSTGATLPTIDPLSGSVLDWLTQAEADANALIAPQSDGSILVAYRGWFGDYGDRILDAGYYVTTGASSLWRMGDVSGGILDEGANSRDGTATGSPLYGQEGPWGSDGPDAIKLTKSGAADGFTIGDFYDLADVNTTTWTLAGWVRWTGDTGSNSCIASKITGGNGWTLSVLTSGRLRFQAFNASSVVCDAQTANGSIPANTWIHVAIVRSGATVWPVLDGVFGTGVACGTIPDTAASLRFGSNAGSSEWFDGRLCMWSITPAALSTALARIIDLDHIDLSGDLEPSAWSETLSLTTVVNHWIFRQFGGVNSYTDSGSIAAYGDRTIEVSSDATTDLSDSYSSGMRATLDQPRLTVECSFHIKGSAQSFLATRQPLHYVARDGTVWQIMSVRHEITVDTWEVSMTLSGTVADLTGAGSALPV